MTTRKFNVEKWSVEDLEDYFKNTLDGDYDQYLTLITNIIYREHITGEAFLLMKKKDWEKCGIIDNELIEYLDNEINQINNKY